MPSRSSRHEVIRWVVLIGLVVTALAVVPPSHASASCIPPSLEISQDTITAGQIVTITGTFFARECNDVVVCEVDDDTGETICPELPPERPISPVQLAFLVGGEVFPLESFDNDEFNFSREITVPADLPPGEAMLVGLGRSEATPQIPVTVLPAAVAPAPGPTIEELADTGAPAWRLVALAGLLVALGVSLRWRWR